MDNDVQARKHEASKLHSGAYFAQALEERSPFWAGVDQFMTKGHRANMPALFLGAGAAIALAIGSVVAMPIAVVALGGAYAVADHKIKAGALDLAKERFNRDFESGVFDIVALDADSASAASTPGRSGPAFNAVSPRPSTRSVAAAPSNHPGAPKAG